MIIRKKKLKKLIQDEIDKEINYLLKQNNYTLMKLLYGKNNRQFYKVSYNQFYRDLSEKYKNNYMDTAEFSQFANKLYNELKLPNRATKNSGCYDIYAPFNICLEPNKDITIPTGLKLKMNNNNVALGFPRSSLGFKFYERLANSIAVIDSDYYNNKNNEGHIFIKLRNDGNEIMIIDKGEAFCQIGIFEYFLTNDDNTNEERVSGIGSTNNRVSMKGNN